MKNSKTIWINNNESRKDVYVDFSANFDCKINEELKLNIIADSNYVAYLNNEIVAFGECSDYPDFKIIRSFRFKASQEHNTLKITVWYINNDSSKYIEGPAGLRFELYGQNKLLLSSNEDILARENINFVNGLKKTITTQLGYSYEYDNNVINNNTWNKSVIVDAFNNARHFSSLVEPTKVKNRKPYKLTKQDDGYLIDFEEETVGFLDLDLISSDEQSLKITWAEHLVNGKIQSRIHERDFSVVFNAKEGHNEFINPLRRIACRYMHVECENDIQINYFGLREVERDYKAIPHQFSDPKVQEIYNVCVNTLTKCMHEHYEDSPWREQCLYALDARNEMLCGHYVFEGHEFQKENIILLSHALTKRGLLSICAPTGKDLGIPSFSLFYIISVIEYINYSKDKSILDEVGDTLKKLISTFDKQVGSNNLVVNFEYPCWNFYEWTDGSANEQDFVVKDRPEQYDLILNCLYVYTRKMVNNLYPELAKDVSKIQEQILKTFFNKEKGLFKLSNIGEKYSVLGNSFAILAGLGNKELVENMKKNENLIDISLSMTTFYYDALLSLGDKFKQHVLDDIMSRYSDIYLESGCMPETALGWKDFDNAASLCHGWSAIPIYYFVKLLEQE